MYGAGDVRVETVPNPAIKEPTDAIVRIVASDGTCDFCKGGPP
jgi:threonine dehydrogenase-like Zn-dependent dehydrogenase